MSSTTPSQVVKVSFAGAPSGSNFKVIGTDLGDDALVVDAGTSYTVGPANDLLGEVRRSVPGRLRRAISDGTLDIQIRCCSCCRASAAR